MASSASCERGEKIGNASAHTAVRYNSKVRARARMYGFLKIMSGGRQLTIVYSEFVNLLERHNSSLYMSMRAAVASSCCTFLLRAVHLERRGFGQLENYLGLKAVAKLIARLALMAMLFSYWCPLGDLWIIDKIMKSVFLDRKFWKVDFRSLVSSMHIQWYISLEI